MKKPVYTESQMYAMNTYRAISAFINEVFVKAILHQYPLPDRFDDGDEWKKSDLAIEQACRKNDIEETMRVCDIYRERAKAYCIKWYEKIQKAAEMEKRTGINAETGRAA